MARKKNTTLAATRRNDILHAAASVFRAKGFHLARTEDICAAAGMSAGTLFRYFRTKAEIIAAIIEVEIDGNDNTIFSLLSHPKGMKKLVTLTGKELQELLCSSKFGLSTESWLELSRDHEGRTRLNELSKIFDEALAADLSRGKMEGWVRPNLNVRGTANLLITLFTGLQFDIDMGLEINFDDTAQAVADLVSTFILAEGHSDTPVAP